MSKYILISLLILLISCEIDTEEQDPERNNEESISNYESQVTETNTNWLNFEYDSSLLYLYGINPVIENLENGEVLILTRIVREGRLNPSVENPEGYLLNNRANRTISNIMNSSSSDENDDLVFEECFEPHYGIVYYNQDSIVAHISISLLCNDIKSYPTSNDRIIDANKFRSIIREAKLPLFTRLDELEEYRKAQ